MKEIFDKLAATKKKKDKIDILKGLSLVETELFKDIARLALSHSHNFYLADTKLPKIPKGSSVLFEAVDLNSQLCELVDVMKRASDSGVGFNNKDAVQRFVGFLKLKSPEVEHIARLILKRNLQCGVAAKLVNEIWPLTIFEKKYMRYSLLTEDNLSSVNFPVITQIKKDAKFANIVCKYDGVRVYSRDWVDNTESYFGEYHEAVEDVMVDLVKQYGFEFVLHGEVGVKDPNTGKFIDRATSNGILNRAVQGIANLRFDIWDCIPYDDFFAGLCEVSYDVRYGTLLTPIIADINNSKITDRILFTLCDSKICHTLDELIAEFNTQKANGEEGIMAKGADNHWKDGTSTVDFKLKTVAACELRVIGETEGKNKYAGMVGAVICESSCGALQVKVSGLTDAQRVPGYFSTGDILECAFNDITKAKTKDALYSLSSPRIIERRDDKHEADDLSKIREQLKNATFFIKK